MAWPKRLVLVRHAESEGNVKSAEERAAFPLATHDYPLTPRGREQARITGEYLGRFRPFGVHYVSYYRRAKETMELIAPGAKVYEDPRLAEAQRGIWHTMTRAEVGQHYPGEIRRKHREGLYHYRPLGGENWPDVEFRIHSFLGTLHRDYDGRNVLMVVHGHWLILFQRLIHHFSIDEAVRRYENSVFENASVTVYRASGRGRNSHLVLEGENAVPWDGMV